MTNEDVSKFRRFHWFWICFRNSLSITRWVRYIDVEGKRLRELKTLIYQRFQHTWVWNPPDEKHENIASREQVHKGRIW